MHIKEMAKKIHHYEMGMERFRENTRLDNSIFLRICVIHSHITECFNHLRREKHQKLGEKFADLILSTFDIAERLNINLEDEIEKRYQYLITCVPFIADSKGKGNHER